MLKKPSIPKGTRDFSAEEIEKRNYIYKTIEKQFKLFCFNPIETPAFENIDTLLGKYGQEGDRLIFKILNSGDFLGTVSDQDYKLKKSSKLSSKITEKALRYDLTVPFSRYVSMHKNTITFPFKRYQIQPVWRADRPQKGRFREFYQCDADVVGSKSLWQEVELIYLYDAVFSELKLPVIIKLNNRKILSGIADTLGIYSKLTDFTIALDKLDKIGEKGVVNELLSKDISEEKIEKMIPFFDLKGSNVSKINKLKDLLKTSLTGIEGIQELCFILEVLEKNPLKKASLEMDITLARGLNYYTGTILEVKTQGLSIGSIGGGGRYDKLTENFGLKNISGVGISFGLDRIHLALQTLNLFPKVLANRDRVLVLNFGIEEAKKSQDFISFFRNKGVEIEFYPDLDKIKKQMSYADKKGFSYVVLIGDEELKNNTFVLKDMYKGSQKKYSFTEMELALNNIKKEG